MTLHEILEKAAENYLWFLLLIIILNLSQRKYLPRSRQKRIATLGLAFVALLYEVSLVLVLTRGLSPYLAFVSLAVFVLMIFAARKRLWPFRLHCPECGASLKWSEIIGSDGNICDACYAKAHPELLAEPEQEKPAVPSSVSDIDWDNWEAQQSCVITYLFRTSESGEREVLLIDKKTGLGKGLVNAPGGHIEAEETAVEAAVREYREETGLFISEARLAGRLRFQFTDGTTLKGNVYFSEAYSGDMAETPEARPFWCKVSEIPFDKMWEDDRYWLPAAMEGLDFSVESVFDDKKMLSLRFTRLEPDE